MGSELVTESSVLKTTNGPGASPAHAPVEGLPSWDQYERVLADRERLTLRLATLLGALPAGVVVLDAQGRVTQANLAAAELLGVLAVGEAWFEVVGRAFAPRWDDGHDVSLADGRRVNVATQALPHEPGQILLIKDVSETRRLQEQLSHHRRLSAKTEMAAALAHQIRTPLAAALLAIGPLARGHGLAESQRRSAERVLESLRQLDRLVENMLSFARGALVDAQPIALTALLERLRLEAAPVLAPGQLALDCGAEHAALQIYGNADALLSSMLNLVANSRQIVGEDCQLRVAVATLGEFVALRFIDNGPGVPVVERARVFEPFHTTRRGGTGLGLSVAQAIARAHGGELGLDVDYPHGACFEFSLPTYTQTPSAQVSA
ncbi:MAG: HAMP domain-containing histidine kinase [Gammaproteobacteria bacterium]|nr:HAMP domain-containing histidine kinase [Gammaproteobacteria bacterium]